MTQDTDQVRVLIVDDDPSMRAALRQWIRLAGFDTLEVATADQAMGKLTPDFEGCVVSDVMLEGEDGMSLLRRIGSLDGDVPVVLITGHGDVPMAVEAMRAGAYDFVEKPFDPDHIAEVVRRACDKRALVLENRALKTQLADGASLESRLIGNSPAMQTLRQQILHFAKTDAAVLITGETGTGKEVIAQALHDFSLRKDGPFAAINAAALPETMVEAELFGHEAGAFTGADRLRTGRIEAASGGVLFLDEIVSMPLALQPKLLRVLQEKKVDRIGGTKPVDVDIRLVSAANMDPREAVRSGNLREDLLFRLNAIELTVPPLRERGRDSLLLFDTFLNRFAAHYGLEVPGTSAQDEAFLQTYGWPGNVRELRNAAERFVLNAGVSPQPLESLVTGQRSEVMTVAEGGLKELMDAYERNLIESALRRHGGRVADVMRELNLPRRTLNEKMARHGLSRDLAGQSETTDA
ncbi:MAG: sigma-54-dependent Fis family transcriptional regulator [Roseibium sp.]|uniref:sigma-54-dependent transcriptional regulator n=1 Tax=Roseibium sp. TaxID=1936156 RepID=UPI001B2A3FF0|nr:sigma-54 dependent transcriptional regulator [Roseibium sp.]MBO6890521.1 sigma-54-dependent Fis family transcriptional regulator [Roseibium sp.]MBO6929566.1 sigma-54-dependent Fis family transcriptional regulator [Roseibium sp.]